MTSALKRRVDKSFRFVEGLSLPISAVTQKFAILGQSGSGKSYAASKLAELMLEVGAQIIVLDPVGIHWGLRAGADGKKAGFPITVFGGDHGDLPLRPESGALVADVLVERSISAVLDVSEFTTSETKKFVRDFAEHFFQRKKRQKSPVHLFMEEAQTFAPQNPEKDEGTMLNRVERLLKIGRNYGIGWTIVSQQPQAIHKRCLNQAGTVIALRTLGKHEKKAIVDWVTDKVSKEEELNLVDTLPSLATGTAHIWSPSWLGVSRTVKVLKKVTFDSSKTPEFGDKLTQPKKLAPIDIEKLKLAMKDLVESAQAGDPEFLRRRISQLETELKQRPTIGAIYRAQKIKEVPVLKDSQVKRLAAAVGKMEKIGAAMEKVSADLVAKATALSQSLNLQMSGRAPLPPPENQYRKLTTAVLDPRLSRYETRAPLAAKEIPALDRKLIERADGIGREMNGAVAPLPRGARTMLAALAARSNDWTTRSQLATLSTMSVGGGSFSNYLSCLRRAGFIEEEGHRLRITNSGLNFIGPDARPTPRTTAELIAMWKAHLPAGARRMLDALVHAHPEWMTRYKLAQTIPMEPTGGSFSNYLSSLRRAGLIEEQGNELRASKTLFLEG